MTLTQTRSRGLRIVSQKATIANSRPRALLAQDPFEFVPLSTVIALPFFLARKRTAERGENEENIRYNIDEYMAAEGL